MSDFAWRPKRTVAECHAILCAPGSLHELETRLIDGRVQRVYKNQWPSVRFFWLWASNLYPDRTYIVFEQQQYTYKEVFDRSLKAVAIFNDTYGVQKGDRVAICSRNYPEYLVAFWACHLIGAVAVLANAWLPTTALLHCLTNTQCKVIMLDTERADRLEPVIKKLTTDAKANGVVVLESHEGKGHWKGMQLWATVFKNYKGDQSKVLQNDPKLVPEDNALIFFTSGTTGLPKAVLSTQRQFLTNTLNTLVARGRAVLRRGEDLAKPSLEDPQQGYLISVPFFHVTQTTSLTMTATFAGAKIVLLRKWNPKEAARLIREHKLSSAGGVPSMSSDLIESELAGYTLDGLSFGGAPAADILTVRARAAFPNVTLSQGYGLTETNSIATSFAGDDYIARPSSCGLPSPVNDVLIVKDGKVVPRGELGEIWIRGCNVMQEYWRDPAATAKVVTKDGWLLSGDIGFQDEEGFVYIRDRIKDLIIRGGENIDCVSVENALFTEGVMEVAAVAVPDKRLGELVAAVVALKPEYRDKITEESLIALARTRLPNFAVPVMIVFKAELEHNPSGKILKAGLRKLAGREWEKRGRRATVAKL
ncbi:hypothetical protein DFH07DRAFT_890342 [Mycena maculata]|uniref:Acetyl-CoA synthetase-like protein n=1 Tax=Mycena maculata TaxID=230809 RepID=A0AAD7IJ99_9AGAR|nr:hypothetical protein DFH07DRAFT_890342 [Mycena maculata]